MTTLEEQVADRLNDMGVPTGNREIALTVVKWVDEGGRLVVMHLPDDHIRIDLYQWPPKKV